MAKARWQGYIQPTYWVEDMKVRILEPTDDPDWPERFGAAEGFVEDTLGKNSRWVLVRVTQAECRDAVGSTIRFPKSSLGVPVYYVIEREDGQRWHLPYPTDVHKTDCWTKRKAGGTHYVLENCAKNQLAAIEQRTGFKVKVVPDYDYKY